MIKGASKACSALWPSSQEALQVLFGNPDSQNPWVRNRTQLETGSWGHFSLKQRVSAGSLTPSNRIFFSWKQPANGTRESTGKPPFSPQLKRPYKRPNITFFRKGHGNLELESWFSRLKFMLPMCLLRAPLGWFKREPKEHRCHFVGS